MKKLILTNFIIFIMLFVGFLIIASCATKRNNVDSTTSPTTFVKE